MICEFIRTPHLWIILVIIAIALLPLAYAETKRDAWNAAMRSGGNAVTYWTIFVIQTVIGGTIILIASNAISGAIVNCFGG